MLILLPNLLSPESTLEASLPSAVSAAVASLSGLIAESPKGGRIFLRHFGRLDLPQTLLNEHTTPEEFEELVLLLQKGERWGLVSDCGLPCLGDPGAQLVLRARALSIPVEALSGPSSIPLGLILSGLPAQSFTFHGYLKRDPGELAAQLRALEKIPTTHLFIEAPYRNEKLLTLLIQTLAPPTLLSVAWNLTAPTQGVVTLPIRTWRATPPPPIGKHPTLFLFHPKST